MDGWSVVVDGQRHALNITENVQGCRSKPYIFLIIRNMAAPMDDLISDGGYSDEPMMEVTSSGQSVSPNHSSATSCGQSDEALSLDVPIPRLQLTTEEERALEQANQSVSNHNNDSNHNRAANQNAQQFGDSIPDTEVDMTMAEISSITRGWVGTLVYCTSSQGKWADNEDKLRVWHEAMGLPVDPFPHPTYAEWDANYRGFFVGLLQCGEGGAGNYSAKVQKSLRHEISS